MQAKETAMNKPKCQIRAENYAAAKAAVYYGTKAGYPRDAIRRQLQEIRIHCGRYMSAAQWIPIIHRAAPRPV